MRYTSKVELVADIVREHDALVSLARDIPASRYAEPGVWGDGWTVCDLLAHLAEWHRFLLRWFEEGGRGETPALPAPGYKWNQLGRLNRAIWEKHRGRAFDLVEDDFTDTYASVMALVEGLSEEQIFQPGHFSWTGKHGLVTYIGGNTSSHYRFAKKCLKRWLRGTIRVAPDAPRD